MTASRILSAFLLLVLPTLAISAPLAAQELQLEAFPKDGQLYPRRADGWATVQIAGAVRSPGWSQLVLRVEKRQGLVEEQVIDLSYAASGAPFSTTTELRAGLRDYHFRLALRGGGGELPVAEARSVVAGDVFLIGGQSNAVALDYWNEQLANQDQSWWVRSFGTQALGAVESRNDQTWYLAEGERQRSRAAVGAWGLALGAKLVERLEVPVAIINGAVGGTGIVAHLRNDADPTDTTTIYGRMLWRAEASGLREHVRAIFFYQGESDGSRAALWGQRFDKLIADWREDYPRLRKIYLMQVRQGCGVPADSLIFESQRELPLRHPEISLMSTSALPGHDGCHYFHAGYEALATQLARLAARDFYRRPFGPEIQPPDAIAAWRANAAGDQLLVEFDAAAVGLQAPAGSAAGFVLEDGAQVISIQVQGPRLLLQLDRPTAASWIRYIGVVGSGEVIRNHLGIGALLFELPLS